MRWLKHAVTDYDNETYDSARLAFVFIIAAFVGLSAFDVLVRGRPFDMAQFGYGIGAILAGFGFSVAGDNFRRPPPTQQTRVTVETGERLPRPPKED